MSKSMILNGEIVPARFDLNTNTGGSLALDDWLKVRKQGGNTEDAGVLIEGEHAIEELRPFLKDCPFVALHLPKWSDGRIYSHARRIRTLWKYEGVILVYGDVLRDQLLYLSRCGINGFYMREDQDLRASLAAFSLYTEHYQYN